MQVHGIGYGRSRGIFSAETPAASTKNAHTPQIRMHPPTSPAGCQCAQTAIYEKIPVQRFAGLFVPIACITKHNPASYRAIIDKISHLALHGVKVWGIPINIPCCRGMGCLWMWQMALSFFDGSFPGTCNMACFCRQVLLQLKNGNCI